MWILLAGAGIAQAQDSASSSDGAFTVTGIRVEGLQRITEGTLFNTLPVNIGDRLDAQRRREALRAVYAMGFFRDVELRREEPGVLVVVVQESPSIRGFSVKGNKDIKTEDLNKSLRNVGLAQGKILNRATLEDVRQALTEQYYAHGRYGVRGIALSGYGMEEDVRKSLEAGFDRHLTKPVDPAVLSEALARR